CSSWTSPPAAWTRCSNRSSWPWCGGAAPRAALCSCPPTRWPRSSTSPTGSPSCAPASWSPPKRSRCCGSGRSAGWRSASASRCRPPRSSGCRACARWPGTTRCCAAWSRAPLMPWSRRPPSSRCSACCRMSPTWKRSSSPTTPREVSLVLRNVFAKTVRDQRRSLGWWSLGLVAVIAVYVLPYRQYLDSGVLSVNTDSAIYQALGYDTTPAGYLQGTLFALLGPLLLVMMAVTTGARAIAGDEEAGTLDLVLAHPVSRARLVAERFAALAAAVTLLGTVIWAGTVVAVAVADMGIDAGRLAAASLGLVLLALGFGTG